MILTLLLAVRWAHIRQLAYIGSGPVPATYYLNNSLDMLPTNYLKLQDEIH